MAKKQLGSSPLCRSNGNEWGSVASRKPTPRDDKLINGDDTVKIDDSDEKFTIGKPNREETETVSSNNRSPSEAAKRCRQLAIFYSLKLAKSIIFKREINYVAGYGYCGYCS